MSSLLDAAGNPITSGKNTNEYTPENMLFIVSLVNKLTDKIEFTFNLLVPFKLMQVYMQGRHGQTAWTLMLNNMVAYVYSAGVKKNGDKPPTNSEEVNALLKEVSTRYAVSVSEPIPSDLIVKDTSTMEELTRALENIAAKSAPTPEDEEGVPPEEQAN